MEAAFVAVWVPGPRGLAGVFGTVMLAVVRAKQI
jgi:hypothetical protein